jgi:hypothetical protein
MKLLCIYAIAMLAIPMVLLAFNQRPQEAPEPVKVHARYSDYL